jgi:hypothetical protein
LTQTPMRERAQNVLTELLNSNLSSASQMNHNCNSRTNVLPSSQRNRHIISNNPSTQPPPSVHQSFTPTTTQISQQCQPKSRLLINQKRNDEDFNKKESSEIILHQLKEVSEISIENLNNAPSIPNDNAQFDGFCQDYNEHGLVTIVTINNLSHQRGNSVA